MAEWTNVKLSEVLKESKVLVSRPNPNSRITVRLNVKGVEKRSETSEKAGATKYYVRKAGQFIYGKQNLFKGAFGVIPKELDGFESSADLPAFDVDKKCSPEWVFFFLKNQNFFERLISIARGAGSKRIAPEDFLKVDLPLPERTLQNEIIDRIKNAESKINEFTFELSKQLSFLSHLRQVVLQEAVEGKLTTEWRKQNPKLISGENHASKLLDKIQAGREILIKDGKMRKEKLIEPLAVDKGMGDLPKGWIWCRFSSYALFERGRFSIRPRNDKSCYGGKYPFIQISSLSDNGDVITDFKQTLNEKGFSVSKQFGKGTIAIAIVGGTIGNLGVLGADMCFPDSMIGVKPSSNCNQDFILLLLRSKQPEIKKAAYQMAGQPNIKLPTLMDLIIPLPPVAEQQAIVKRVGELMTIIDEFEKQVTERKEQSETLMRSVLREAFEKRDYEYDRA